MNTAPYFSVKRPTRQTLPLVVEVPHAGLNIDALAIATLVAPARSIGRDADLYVDELCAAAPELGAPLLQSHTSRYVCDLNRGERDYDRGAAPGGGLSDAPHGLFWRRTTEGAPALERPLPQSEVDRRVNTIYRPYHQTLNDLLAETKHRFGFAVLLCAHSMPSSGRAGHADTGTHRADIVPGSRGRSTAAEVVVLTPDRVAQKYGFSVAHDQPYRGGFSTAHYGRPEQSVHAVQVEMNRQLYMDENTLKPLPGRFERARDYFSDVVRELGQLALSST